MNNSQRGFNTPYHSTLSKPTQNPKLQSTASSPFNNDNQQISTPKSNITQKKPLQSKRYIQKPSNLSTPKRGTQYQQQQSRKFSLQDMNDSITYEDDLIQQQQQLLSQYTREQIQSHVNMIQNLWQYRYSCYLQNGIKNKQWMRLFSFLGEFKQKCINLVKKMINSNFTAYRMLEDIDYRSNMKNDGESGIYLIDGIILRVARYKYTEDREIDDSAVKTLHQEFISLNVINNLYLATAKDEGVENVRVPLTCLVKYLGYTVLCQADSPCEGLETLIHGPTATIYQYRQQSLPLLQRVGQELNLKPFKMMAKDGKILTIPFCLTVELHRVTRKFKNQNLLKLINPNSCLYPQTGLIFYDKPEYYLLNIRKLWPLFIDNDIMKSSGFLRPQVVLAWKNRLSNTVFSPVAYQQDPNSELQLADACKTLKQENIKILAKMLDNTTIFLIDSQGIQQIMHEYGVNIRFMGELAKRVTLEFSKKVLQTQMIARTCKKYFFPTFNQVIQNNKIKDVVGYLKQVFVDFLNLIFIRNDEGEKFYRNYIYRKIKTYYEYEIKEYPPVVPGGGMLHALAYHFGIKVKVIDYPFFQVGVESIFNIGHITEVIGFAKTFDMDTSEVKLLCKKFKDKRKKNNLTDCIAQLKLLAAINKNLNHQKTHTLSPYRESYYYAQLAQIYFNLKQYQTAKNYAQLSLKGIPEKHADAIKPFGVLIKYHSMKKQANRCIEYYQKSLGYLGYHLSPDHPLSIAVYNTLGYQFVSSMDPAKCEKIFMKSFQICQQALGYMHHTSSEILMQLAGLPLPPEKTINFLLQSLTILENLNDHPELIKEVSMRISEMYDKLGNVHKMIYYAKKSGHWRMEIRGQDRLTHDKNVFDLCNRIPASIDQLSFLTYYAVKSYVYSLDNIPKQTLYKVFVTYKDSLLPREVAQKILFKRMTSDRSNLTNMSDYVKSNFVLIFRDISKKLSKHHFYVTQIDQWDKQLKSLLEIFIEIMSIVGIQEAQEIFLSYKKTF